MSSDIGWGVTTDLEWNGRYADSGGGFDPEKGMKGDTGWV